MSSMTLAMLLTLKDMASGPLGDFKSKLSKTSTDLMSTGAVAMEAGRKITGMLKAPIAAFAEAEDAGIRLKNSLSDKDGVAKGFEEVNKLANQLGKDLPGNTADFQNLMAVLKDNKIAVQDIVGGVGKAASYLGVQLKMPFEAAGLLTAKLSKAAGIAASDMLDFMDIIQKTASMGVEASQMEMAFARSAGALKTAGLQGLDNAKGMSVIFGQLIRAGVSAETAGTGMATILTSLTDFNLGLSKNAIDAKKTLDQAGLKLEFFKKNADGTQSIKGPREFIKELEKLNTLTEKQRGGVFKKLFGTGQDLQIVQQLLANGLKEFDADSAEMDNKLDLKSKVEAQLKSLTNIWDAASGTFTNMLAGLGSSIAPELKALSDAFAEISDKILKFTEKNPDIAKMVVGLTALSGIGLLAGGGVMMGGGILLNAASTGIEGFQKIGEGAGKVRDKMGDAVRGVKDWNQATGSKLVTNTKAAGSAIKAMPQKIGAGLKAMPGNLRAMRAAASAQLASNLSAAGSAIKSMPTRISAAVKALPGNLRAMRAAANARLAAGLKSAALGIRSIGLAAMANPVGFIIAGIAVAALLIYKYWGPIKGFFSGLWSVLKQGIKDVSPAFKEALKPVAPMIDPIIDVVKALWGWFKDLLKPVEDTGGAFEQMGRDSGLAIVELLFRAADWLGWIIRLPGNVWGAISRVNRAFWDGLYNAWVTVVNWFKVKGEEIKTWFLGLPSYLAQIGKDMMQGLVDGVTEKWEEVKKSLSGFADKIKGVFTGVFKIQSPSRVFAYYGQMLGAGLELGMVSSTANITKAASQIAKAATPELPTLAGPELRPSSLSVQPVAAANQNAAAAGSGGVQITFAPVYQLGNASETVAQQVQSSAQATYQDFRRFMERYKEEIARPRWT